MRSVTIRSAAFWTALITFAAANGSALAQKKYDTGATDTEIKIGHIVPYSDQPPRMASWDALPPPISKR